MCFHVFRSIHLTKVVGTTPVSFSLGKRILSGLGPRLSFGGEERRACYTLHMCRILSGCYKCTQCAHTVMYSENIEAKKKHQWRSTFRCLPETETLGYFVYTDLFSL